MKAKDIKVGGVYMVKVSEKLVPVRVIRFDVNPWNGRDNWYCQNTITKRLIHVRSAQRFRWDHEEQERKLDLARARQLLTERVFSTKTGLDWYSGRLAL